MSALETRIATMEHKMSFIEKMVAIGTKTYLTMDEAAAYTGMKENQLYHLTSSKQIPFSKPGGKLLFFHKSDLDNYMAGNRTRSKAEINEAADTHLVKLRTQKKKK